MNTDRLPDKPSGEETAPRRTNDARPEKGDKAPDAETLARHIATKESVRGSRRRSDPIAVDPERRGDQVPRREIPISASAGAQAAADGYVRLRMHVDDNRRVSVVSSNFVAGPLAEATELHGDTFYEVTGDDGTRLLHAESIPDLDTVRSFANPDGPEFEHRHNTYRLTSYDFDVRVPASELSVASLASVAVAVYRTPEAVAIHGLERRGAPIRSRLVGEVDELARFESITVDDLPTELGLERTGTKKREGSAD